MVKKLPHGERINEKIINCDGRHTADGWTSFAAELLIGAAEISVTPERPVSLAGQFHNRIARSVESPCMACVLALESREEGKPAEQVMIIALDTVYPTMDGHNADGDVGAPRRFP